jgi:hypothetical protein
MGLVRWENVNDNFSHEQLASNFSLLDEHDHTPGKGKQIPFGGLAAQSVGISNLRSGLFTEITNALDIPITYYTPTIITAEQSREGTSFATLSTADEIKNIVLPPNGLIQIFFVAKVKSSVSSAGQVTAFLGSNQILQSNNAPVFAYTNSIEYASIGTSPGGLQTVNNSAPWVTTGQTLGRSEAYPGGGGPMTSFAAAGTYNLTIQYKASSGSVTAKERKLWAIVFG